MPFVLTPETVRSQIRSLLSPQQRLILYLWCQNMSLRQIAQEFGVKEGGVQRQFFRVIREKLKLDFFDVTERNRILKTHYCPELKPFFALVPTPQSHSLVPIEQPDDLGPPLPEETFALVLLRLEDEAKETNQPAELALNRFQALIPRNPSTTTSGVPAPIDRGSDVIDVGYRYPRRFPPVLAFILGVLTLAILIGAAFWWRFLPLTIPGPVLTPAVTVIDRPVEQTVVVTAPSQPTYTPLPSQTPLPTYTPFPPAIAPPPIVDTVTVPSPSTTVVIATSPSPSSAAIVQSVDDCIPFADPASPEIPAAGWRWAGGSSPTSKMRLDGTSCRLALLAGRGTNYWNGYWSAPTLGYPLTGNVQVQVKIDFNPTEKYQVAALGLRAEDDPNNWTAIERWAGDGRQVVQLVKSIDGGGQGITDIPYAKTAVHFRITRRNEQLTFEMSDNGQNWITLAKNYQLDLQKPLQAFLLVYSTSGNDIQATFSDFVVREAPPEAESIPSGAVAFADPNNPAALHPMWGWFPGSSTASTFQINEGRLTIITGPGTNKYRADNTAPYVVLPLPDKFTATLRLDFDPSQNYQTAGMQITTLKHPFTWIELRRWFSGGRQGIQVLEQVDGGPTDRGTKDYPGTTIYLRIHRSEPEITLEYSENGSIWTPIQQKFIKTFLKEDTVVLVLYVHSTPSVGIAATFSDLTITPE